MEKIMHCKSCGAQLDVTQAVDGVVVCEYCQSKWTVPKPNSDNAATHFLKTGEHELDICDFDHAYTSFSKAAELDPSEPEAYFGMALATFNVQYLKDEVNNRLQPICHENSTISSAKFVEDKNYLKAMACATETQKSVYKAKAREIDYIHEEFLRQQQQGVDYDCFICVKVTDNETHERTKDCHTAGEIYDYLRLKGFKVFFSEKEISNLQGADYESRILYALYSSECMLVVCSNEEYLQTRWVKNEYTRFLSMIENKMENKEHDCLTIVFDGKPIERLPGRQGKIQGINWNNRDSLEQIRNFVDLYSPQGRARRAAEEKKKQEELARRREEEKRNREEQEKLRLDLERQRKEIEEKISNLQNNSTQGVISLPSLLQRAKQFLDDNDAKNAASYFNKVLDFAPNNAEAWWGLFLIEFNATNESQILKDLNWHLWNNIVHSKNFNKVLAYSTGSIDERVSAFVDNIQNPELWWKLFLKERKISPDNVLEYVNSKRIKEIYTDKTFINAQTFAKGTEVERIINDFLQQLTSPEVYWKLFLESNHAADENEIVERLRKNDRKIKVINNPLYIHACRYSEGELQEKIRLFQQKLNGSELWWQAFLCHLKVGSEQQILSEFFKYKDFDFESESNLQRALALAGDDELGKRIKAFSKRLFSFGTYWNVFFKNRKCRNEEDFLTNKFDYRAVSTFDTDKYFLLAKKYATEEENKRIERFVAAAKEQYGHVINAHRCLQKVFEKCKVKNAIEFKQYYSRDIENDKNYSEATKYITKSNDSAEITWFRSLFDEQKRYTNGIYRARKHKITTWVMFAVAGVVGIAIFLLNFLANTNSDIGHVWFTLVQIGFFRVVLMYILPFFFIVFPMIGMAIKEEKRVDLLELWFIPPVWTMAWPFKNFNKAVLLVVVDIVYIILGFMGIILEAVGVDLMYWQFR